MSNYQINVPGNLSGKVPDNIQAESEEQLMTEMRKIEQQNNGMVSLKKDESSGEINVLQMMTD